MADYYFERDCRTPYSESYAILDDDQAIGRIDLHFAGNLVHGTLSIPERYTQEAIQELIETIDEDLLDSVGITRDEFVVHVFQGKEVGVFSDNDLGGEGNGHISG